MKLAVLACMDARLTVEHILGLNTGDSQIMRNASGIPTDDAVRSLIVSHQLFRNTRIRGCNHTNCGIYDEKIRKEHGYGDFKHGYFLRKPIEIKDLVRKIKKMMESD